jgi:hypothetical protein
MTRVVPFTDQANPKEAKVMRLMIYVGAIDSDPADFGGDIDTWNAAFETMEKVLDELGGDPDDAIEFVVDDGYTYVQSSEKLQEAIMTVSALG